MDNDIVEELSLLGNENISEQELLEAIKGRVAQMLETEPELLMSYLYRLDILEVNIKAVLSKNSMISPVDGLSQLILERQKERQATKLKYKQEPIEGWEW